MTPVQNIFYAVGQFAYSLSMADGTIQQPEKTEFRNFLIEEMKNSFSADYADIIFSILEKDKVSLETALEWGRNSINESRPWLNSELSNKLLNLLDKLAVAYPPVTEKEQQLLLEFKSLFKV